VGAFHVALASFLLQAVAWAGAFHPAADIAMLDLFEEAVAEWLFARRLCGSLIWRSNPRCGRAGRTPL
jgi:hypothetical protein